MTNKIQTYFRNKRKKKKMNWAQRLTSKKCLRIASRLSVCLSIYGMKFKFFLFIRISYSILKDIIFHIASVDRQYDTASQHMLSVHLKQKKRKTKKSNQDLIFECYISIFGFSFIFIYVLSFFLRLHISI